MPYDESAGENTPNSKTFDLFAATPKPAAENYPKLGAPRLPDGRLAKAAVCEDCGREFLTRAKSPGVGRGRYCSASCKGRAIAKTRLRQTILADSAPGDRIRANGLINKRIKLGWIERPTQCLLCGRAGRTDAHHPDYRQPDVVAFLCRSCHMKAHRSEEVNEQATALAQAVSRRQGVAK